MAVADSNSNKENPTTDETMLTFAMVPKSVDNPFFDVAMDGCMDAAQLLGVTCLWTGPSVEDPEGLLQAEILSDLLENKSIDGLAVSVASVANIVPLINQAAAQNIPVITFDSDAPDSDRLAYIGTNNTFLGVQLGKTVKQLVPNGGTFAILSGPGPNLKEREKGVRLELEDTQDKVWNEISTSSLDHLGNITLAMEMMHQFANESPTVIVPVMGMPMRSDSWKDLINQHRGKNITFVNGDAMDIQLHLLNRGYADGLVGQLPYEMGFKSIQSLVLLAAGNTLKSDFVGTNVLTHIYIPLELPELIVDHNLVGDLIIVGYILFGLVMIMVIGLCLWTRWNRENHIIQASQPAFLYMIAFGVMVLASCLVPLSFDDSGVPSSVDGTTGVAICMSIPWLGCLGFSIIFSSLVAKLLLIYKLFNPANGFSRLQVRGKDVLAHFYLLLLANIAILLAWTLVDPLTYVRSSYEGTDGWGRTIETYGACKSQNATVYLTLLGIVNVGGLMEANWYSYRTRNVQMEFAESKYIAIAMGSMLQAFLTGIPILIIVRELPKAFYLTLVFIIFITATAILLVIFIPKLIFANEFSRYTPREQHDRLRDSIQSSMLSFRGAGEDLSSPSPFMRTADSSEKLHRVVEVHSRDSSLRQPEQPPENFPSKSSSEEENSRNGSFPSVNVHTQDSGTSGPSQNSIHEA